jgi:hypothetical protein
MSRMNAMGDSGFGGIDFSKLGGGAGGEDFGAGAGGEMEEDEEDDEDEEMPGLEGDEPEANKAAATGDKKIEEVS